MLISCFRARGKSSSISSVLMWSESKCDFSVSYNTSSFMTTAACTVKSMVVVKASANAVALSYWFVCTKN